MAMNFTLDELKTIAGIFTPAPVAPVAAVAPLVSPPGTLVPSGQDIIAMAKDIQYLVKGYDEMKVQLQKMGDTHVTLVDMANHIGEDNKRHTDEDKRAETFVTKDQFSTVRTVVYGMVGIILSSFVLGLFYLLVHK